MARHPRTWRGSRPGRCQQAGTPGWLLEGGLTPREQSTGAVNVSETGLGIGTFDGAGGLETCNYPCHITAHQVVLPCRMDEPWTCSRRGKRSTAHLTSQKSADGQASQHREGLPGGSAVSNSTPAIAGLNDGSLRVSATMPNTRTAGAAMRT